MVSGAFCYGLPYVKVSINYGLGLAALFQLPLLGQSSLDICDVR